MLSKRSYKIKLGYSTSWLEIGYDKEVGALRLPTDNMWFLFFSSSSCSATCCGGLQTGH